MRRARPASRARDHQIMPDRECKHGKTSRKLQRLVAHVHAQYLDVGLLEPARDVRPRVVLLRDARAARPISTRRGSSLSRPITASLSASGSPAQRASSTRESRPPHSPRMSEATAASRRQTPRRAPARSSRLRATACTATFAVENSCVRTSFVTMPSTSMPASSKRMRACRRRVLERVGADQRGVAPRSRDGCRATRAAASGSPLRASWRPTKTTCVQRSARDRPDRGSATPFGMMR